MSIPGMMYPTTKGMIGSNPSDSARLLAINKAQTQTNANKLMSGGKRRRKHRGGIVVPQYQMLYEPQGGIGTNPNNQIQINSQTSTQMAANSVYDNQATKMGGTKRRNKRKKCGKTKTKKNKKHRKY